MGLFESEILLNEGAFPTDEALRQEKLDAVYNYGLGHPQGRLPDGLYFEAGQLLSEEEIACVLSQGRVVAMHP